MVQEKITALISKQKKKGNKKNIENLVVFLVILIVTIIAINTIWNEDDKPQKQDISNNTKTLATDNIPEQFEVQDEKNELEHKLESILEKIEGVGKVSVLITYSQTSEVIAMYNENTKESSTEESDTDGGARKILEKDNSKEVIYKDQNGEKIPVTQKIILPKIEGAIITAEGANSVNIKANIIQAVEVATGLATHKIQVFTMKI